jgi:hypothetical protein
MEDSMAYLDRSLEVVKEIRHILPVEAVVDNNRLELVLAFGSQHLEAVEVDILHCILAAPVQHPTVELVGMVALHLRLAFVGREDFDRSLDLKKKQKKI